MPNYTIMLLPPNSNKIQKDKLVEIATVMNGNTVSTPPIIFGSEAPHPRSGFDASSIVVTDYGIKAKYLIEEEVIIPTADGEVKNFRIVVIPGKFITKEGVLLISGSADKVNAVAGKWADVFFPAKIVNCKGINLSLEQLHKVVNDNARTIIEISHVECKGLEKIRMKAYDLPKKEWYKEEGFEEYGVDHMTFVPNLNGELAKKTPICRLHRSGRFVIYRNSNFSDEEFEQIELQLVDMIAETLGRPLCKFGSSSSQGRLVAD